MTTLIDNTPPRKKVAEGVEQSRAVATAPSTPQSLYAKRFIEIWPQEVYYITGLLILAALGLFLATSLFGRVWCGYACPQTIWTDLFIQVEKFFEGDRNARMKLDKAPWTTKKVFKKTGKHLVWLLIAALTGGAWILYFHDAPTVFRPP